MRITVTQRLRVVGAAFDLELEPGEHKATDPATEAAFALLIEQGFATVAAPTKTAKEK